MTLDELLELARKVHAYGGAKESERLAAAVRDLLGESQPCGWPEPVAAAGGITWDALPMGETITPGEARAIAVMLLRAADEADGAGR